jgi:hypothetical protein
MHAQHAARADDEAMGFSHTLTRHSFRLLKSGGTITVTANAPDDEKSISAIREHLQSIVKSFAEGDFAKPMLTHGRLPDGADVMQDRRDTIAYRYEHVPAGGQVIITTSDPQALDAVHRFLRFQIDEHRTGDVVPGFSPSAACK